MRMQGTIQDAGCAVFRNGARTRGVRSGRNVVAVNVPSLVDVETRHAFDLSRSLITMRAEKARSGGVNDAMLIGGRILERSGRQR